MIQFFDGESSPGGGFAEIAIDFEISCGAGVFIGGGGIPAGVDDEDVLSPR